MSACWWLRSECTLVHLRQTWGMILKGQLVIPVSRLATSSAVFPRTVIVEAIVETALTTLLQAQWWVLAILISWYSIPSVHSISPFHRLDTPFVHCGGTFQMPTHYGTNTHVHIQLLLMHKPTVLVCGHRFSKGFLFTIVCNLPEWNLKSWSPITLPQSKFQNIWSLAM